MFGLPGSKAMLCWSGWIDWPVVPLLLIVCQVHNPGGSATAVHVPPARRHRYPVGIGLPPGWGIHGAPVPKAYATSVFEGAVETASRTNDAGAPGRVTAFH